MKASFGQYVFGVIVFLLMLSIFIYSRVLNNSLDDIDVLGLPLTSEYCSEISNCIYTFKLTSCFSERLSDFTCTINHGEFAILAMFPIIILILLLVAVLISILIHYPTKKQ